MENLRRFLCLYKKSVSQHLVHDFGCVNTRSVVVHNFRALPYPTNPVLYSGIVNNHKYIFFVFQSIGPLGRCFL